MKPKNYNKKISKFIHKMLYTIGILREKGKHLGKIKEVNKSLVQQIIDPRNLHKNHNVKNQVNQTS
jgi:hypothetical protein